MFIYDPSNEKYSESSISIHPSYKHFIHSDIALLLCQCFNGNLLLALHLNNPDFQGNGLNGSNENTKFHSLTYYSSLPLVST